MFVCVQNVCFPCCASELWLDCANKLEISKIADSLLLMKIFEVIHMLEISIWIDTNRTHLFHWERHFMNILEIWVWWIIGFLSKMLTGMRNERFTFVLSNRIIVSIRKREYMHVIVYWNLKVENREAPGVHWMSDSKYDVSCAILVGLANLIVYTGYEASVFINESVLHSVSGREPGRSDLSWKGKIVNNYFEYLFMLFIISQNWRPWWLLRSSSL